MICQQAEEAKARQVEISALVHWPVAAARPSYRAEDAPRLR